MPYAPEDKKRAITRLRRIRGQAESLEREIAVGASCGDVLQQLAAMRGAINGLMSDVLQGHVREAFGDAPDAPVARAGKAAKAEVAANAAAIEQTVALIRSYLK